MFFLCELVDLIVVGCLVSFVFVMEELGVCFWLFEEMFDCVWVWFVCYCYVFVLCIIEGVV